MQIKLLHNGQKYSAVISNLLRQDSHKWLQFQLLDGIELNEFKQSFSKGEYKQLNSRSVTPRTLQNINSHGAGEEKLLTLYSLNIFTNAGTLAPPNADI